MNQAIRDAFEKRDIRRVKVGGFDVDGILRGKYIALDKFWSSLEKGFGFCDVIFGWDVADELYDNVAVTGWDSGFPGRVGEDRPVNPSLRPERATHRSRTR